MPEEKTKYCSKCLRDRFVDCFSADLARKDGLNGVCKDCKSKLDQARNEKNRVANQARLDSKYVSLGGGNYTPLNRGTTDKVAKGLKQQEFTQEMGELTDTLREGGSRMSSFVTNLAEDESRYENRRLSRSVSISLARDELSLRRFRQAAREYLSEKIVPAGYAAKKTSKPIERVANILLSDLHFGAELVAVDNPEPYTALEESRRFGKIIAEVRDYKPQYRAKTALNVYLNGDLIEGYLLHDLRDGAPLTEQTVAFWKYLSAALAIWSAAYPKVTVEFQPGNHGRNRLRHPGRATSSKWDAHETQLAIGLAMMSSGLKNVEFRGCGFDHRQAVSNVALPGEAKLCLTHGDTEIKLGHPDTRAAQNFSELSNINATQRYGEKYDVFAFGHFHTARVQRCQGYTAIWNGALVPSNGHARVSGYAKEACGQWLWESVPGYPVGDMRFLEVGAAEDNDPTLNKICPPFRFEK